MQLSKNIVTAQKPNQNLHETSADAMPTEREGNRRLAPLNIWAILNRPLPKLDFVLPGLLAQGVGMLVGQGGAGKTTYAMQLSMACATGTSFGCGDLKPDSPPFKVVLLAAEESTPLMSHRIHAIYSEFGNDELNLEGQQPNELMNNLCQNLVVIPAAAEPVLLTENRQPSEFFKTLCERASGARLIIIDPLRRLHAGDENSSACMTEVVQDLELLAKKTGAAVVVVHHMNKGSTSNNSSNSSRGSSALSDGVRWHLNLCSNEDNSCATLSFAKTNYIGTQKPITYRRTPRGVLVKDDSGESMNSGKSESRKGRKSDTFERVSLK